MMVEKTVIYEAITVKSDIIEFWWTPQGSKKALSGRRDK